jgi:TP901 family phage tail tape measure protein
MADAQIRFGIDTRELFAGLQNVSTQTQQTITKLEQDANRLGAALASNMGKGAGGIANSKRELQAFIEENKRTLTAMQLNGEAGTKAYQAIQTSVKQATAEMNKIDAAARSVENSLKDVGAVGAKAAGDVSGSAGKIQGTLSSVLGPTAIGGLIGGGVAGLATTAISAITNVASAAFDEYKALDKNIANIGTLGVEAAGLSLDKFEGLINDLSTRAPDKASNIANGVYNAISAGITGSEEEIVKFVETASRVGVAGVADTNAAVNGLTSVVNAYGLGAAGAEQTSNIFFATIKAGKTSFNELNAGLANIVPAASAAGIGFEEVGATIAKLTTVGIPTAQATTQLRSAIIELQKPAKPLQEVLAKVGLNAANMGAQLKKPAAEGGGLINTLQMVEKAAKDSGLSLTQVFGSAEAASAALSLTGKNAASALSVFEGVQKDVADGVANKAYEAASKSIDVQMSIIKNKVQAGFNSIFKGTGDALGMIGEAVGPSLQRLFDGFAGTWQRIWSVVGPILALIGGSIMSSIVYAIDIIAETANIAYNVFISVFDGIANAIQPIIDAFKQVGAVIGDALGFGDKGGQALDFMGIFQSVLNGVGDAIRFVADLISGALSGAISFVLTPVRFLAEVIGSVITKVAEWIKQSGILETVIGAVTSAVDFFQGIIQSIEGAFNAVIATVNDLIGFWNEMTSIVNLSGNVWQGFQSALNSVWEIIKNVANAIFDFGANIITTYLIEPVKAAIGWVTGIVSKIGEWVLSFGAVQGVITILRNAAAGVSSFFANIGSYIDTVKMAIGGIVSALNEVGNLVSEFFGAISRADFSGAYNVVANSINRISSAYKEGQETAGKYLQAQKDQEAQAAKMASVLDKLAGSSTNAANKQKVLNDFIVQQPDGTKPPPGGDDDTEEKEKGKTEKTITEFQKRKNAYDQFAARLEVSRESEFAKFTDQQKRESSEYQKRLLNDSNKLNEFLNEQFQKSKTTEFLDLPVKIKPQGDTETDVNIQKFYVDTFLKNRDAVNKLADAQLKEQLKTEAEARKQAIAEAEKQYKELSDIIAADIKQNTTAIATAIPNTGALTQTQYDEAKKNGDDYIETLRAKGRFINDQLVSAQIAGADKAAEALQKQLDANNGLLSSAEQRLAAYVDASDVTLQNSTLANVAAYAAQRALIGAFLNDKTQAEREQAEQARAARLAELNQEETDLETSLAKREISFDEFQQKLGAIADARREQEGDAENNFNSVLANLKRSGEQALNEIAKQQSAPMIATAKAKQEEILKAENDLAQAQRALNRTLITDTEQYAKAQQDVAEKTKALAGVDEQTYGFRTAVLEEFAGRAIEQFGALAATGTATLGDFGKAGLKIAADLLAQQIPIFVAQIFGTTVGQLGPFGVVVAGGLTATLWALYNEAVAGFKTGGYTGDAGTDEVTGVVHGQEYVLNAEATRANRDVLEWANKTNRPISEYYKFHTVETSTTAVTHDGQLINEVQKLREETRNLGVHIRRNTTVELTGQLVADGNSINAMIEHNKRKTIRRG